MVCPLKITIVEDDKIVQNVLIHRVKKLGHSVISQFESGEEAIAHIAESLPNLVIMGINLGGGIDGIQTAFRIQSQFNLPIVFVSGDCDDETIRRVNNIIGAEFVVKPITDDDIRIAILLAIDKYFFINQLKTRDALCDLLFEWFLGGIIATNTEGIITNVNESARSLIKWRAPVNKTTHFREIVTIINESGIPLENAYERKKKKRKSAGFPRIRRSLRSIIPGYR